MWLVRRKCLNLILRPRPELNSKLTRAHRARIYGVTAACEGTLGRRLRADVAVGL